MTDTLVIGYGNTLREDDGVGPRLAERVATWNRPGVRALAVLQLLPELAEMLATARQVIFVDASVTEETVQLRPLSPAETKYCLNHLADPRWLLSLTARLYSHHPRAWLLTIPASTLEFGEELSASAKRGVETALLHIERLSP
jgi:hydrogenase maturation protease